MPFTYILHFTILQPHSGFYENTRVLKLQKLSLMHIIPPFKMQSLCFCNPISMLSPPNLYAFATQSLCFYPQKNHISRLNFSLPSPIHLITNNLQKRQELHTRAQQTGRWITSDSHVSSFLQSVSKSVVLISLWYMQSATRSSTFQNVYFLYCSCNNIVAYGMLSTIFTAFFAP